MSREAVSNLMSRCRIESHNSESEVLSVNLNIIQRTSNSFSEYVRRISCIFQRPLNYPRHMLDILCMHAYAQTRMCKTCMHTRAFACVHACMRACVHTSPSHEGMHACEHAFTHVVRSSFLWLASGRQTVQRPHA